MLFNTNCRQFAVASDGGRFAYEVAGRGPTLVLLHGGGQDRHVWSKAGWIRHLAVHFQVIAMDIRGHGESWKPTYSAGYGIDQLCEDILAVADAAGEPDAAGVRVMLAGLGALLEWPAIEPAQMQCPTLWLVGTANVSAMKGVNRYERDLDDTPVRVGLVEGLTHSEELERWI